MTVERITISESIAEPIPTTEQLSSSEFKQYSNPSVAFSVSTEPLLPPVLLLVTVLEVKFPTNDVLLETQKLLLVGLLSFIPVSPPQPMQKKVSAKGDNVMKDIKFKENLKLLRKDAKLTQEALSRKLNTTIKLSLIRKLVIASLR